jgi:EAL domain-containing protein (putative c-di-GMP-specific phosphodiesterase class I)/GGDEF domain-containing protein
MIMGFLEQFTLYDVFLVAVGLVTASIVRIFYDSYKERKRLEELDELVNVYNESMNAYEEGIIIISDQNEIIFSNKEGRRMMKADSDTLTVDYLKSAVKIRLQGSTKEHHFLSTIEERKNISSAQIIINNHSLPIAVHSNTFQIPSDSAKQGLWRIIIMQDFTGKIKLQEKIESTGLSKDILTGLPIKHHMTGKLLSTILSASQNKEESALGMIGIESYHALQAKYGTDKVDFILKMIVESISRDMTEDETLYQFDNDNFAIIFEKISNISKLERRLNHFEISIKNILSNEGMESEVLTGFSPITEPYPTVEQVINSSLSSLYSRESTLPNAKSKTEVSAANYTESAYSPAERLGKRDFEDAIKNNDFFFFYQPIYELKKDKLIGVEVLTRLNYKKEGLIFPNTFLQQAIECNMMTEVTSHLLDHVLSQKRFWSTQVNEDLDTTINLSISDIHSGVFTEALEKKILEYEINPATITIDISEEIFEQDFKSVFEECYMLEKLGVKLAVDHFGKGSITLKNLSVLPLHAIKIDGSVIEGVEIEEDKVRLVSGMISMGRKLGLDVGATFVDSEAVKIVLGRVGCSFAQGNYLGKAAPAFEITDLMHNV